MRAALAFVALLASAVAVPWKSQLPLRSTLELLEATGGPSYHQVEARFDGQRLDHFVTDDRRTWSQRYWTIADYWDAPHGPVIFHICGEYTCPGINPERLFPLEMAEKYGALVVTLEHRFYGESVPFGHNTTVDHLQYLNSRQGINDLAWFSEWFQEEQINKVHGITGRNKWSVVGGSYPGALASWYRLKFPQMSVGSHSSSGVVLAVLNYTAFDEQVASSAGPECADALRAVTADVEAKMPAIKSAFNAEMLEDGDFYYLIADSAAEGIQYGHRDIVCDAVTPPFKAGDSPLPAFINYTQSFFYKQMGNSPSDYDSSITANPLLGGDGRSWRWQTCSELAYWQMAPAEGAIRSQALNFTYFTNYCYKVFGLTVLPDVEGTNNYYGGNTTSASNTWYEQGVQDPWRWAGVQKDLAPDMNATVVDCDGCAHCCTLYTPAESDPPALKAARDSLRLAYDSWLGD